MAMRSGNWSQERSYRVPAEIAEASGAEDANAPRGGQARFAPGGNFVFAPALTGRAPRTLEYGPVCEMELEGIVAKH